MSDRDKSLHSNDVPTEQSYEARWWRLMDDRTIMCELCPRGCQLGDGQRGYCWVRQARGQRLWSACYGRSSSVCIDPIEKKPLNHFYPGSAVLSLGTVGCNLGCVFCQNSELSRSQSDDYLTEITSPAAIAKAAAGAGCKSVAFTYNEPAISGEFMIDCSKECHDLGVKTVAVTSGYVQRAARAEMFAHIDAANVDLKGFTDAFYVRNCAGHLEPVLETLTYLARETSVWLEVTTLLISGENDTDDELARLCEWHARELGADVPIHFSAFHPAFKMTHIPRTPPATLIRARTIAQRAGINFVYTGNVVDPNGQSTFCPGCKKCVIRRDGFRVASFDLDIGGHCAHCGRSIPGRFQSNVGSFDGQRRQTTIR